MKNKKKIILRIVFVIAAIFVFVNIAWSAWRNFKYSSYTDGMQKNDMSGFLVPSYYKQDADGFDYSVKYPDYLSFTGNLSLGMPAEGDNPYTDALIIWPAVRGGYEYGFILYEGEDQYLIEADESGKALEKKYDAVVKAHQKNIDLLLEKAYKNWNLKEGGS